MRTVVAVMVTLAVLSVGGVANALEFMNITFDGDSIGNAPSTAPASPTFTTVQAIGGYAASTINVYGDSPPTADSGTIKVQTVGGSNAAVMATNPANHEVGALWMDTGFAMTSTQLGLKFDIDV